MPSLAQLTSALSKPASDRGVRKRRNPVRIRSERRSDCVGIRNSDNIVYGLGPLYVVKADTTTVTLAHDGSKNVRAEIASTGAVTAGFRYRSYGQLAQSTAAGPSYLGLASQLLDPSGLYYMRARWYEPTTGRFTSRDPEQGEGARPFSLNLYLYGQANPLIKADPTGRFCFLIGFGSKVAIGATPPGTAGGGAGAAAQESWSLAFCDGGRGLKGLNVGLVNTSGHFASEKTGANKDIVEGAYAGFGLQGAVSLQANRAEDLAGPFATESVDAGALWPVDIQYEWAHGESPPVDVITFAPPFLSAGVGLDYTRMTTDTQSRTFWSLDNGWGWAP